MNSTLVWVGSFWSGSQLRAPMLLMLWCSTKNTKEARYLPGVLGHRAARVTCDPLHFVFGGSIRHPRIWLRIHDVCRILDRNATGGLPRETHWHGPEYHLGFDAVAAHSGAYRSPYVLRISISGSGFRWSARDRIKIHWFPSSHCRTVAWSSMDLSLEEH